MLCCPPNPDAWASGLGRGLAVITLIAAAVPPGASAQSAIPAAAQRCAIGSGGVFQAVIPCGVTTLNDTLTITWPFAGRGVGTNVAAEGQWHEWAGSWRACSSQPTCLEARNGGFQIRQTACPLTLPMQPIELDGSYPRLAEGC